MPDQYQTQPYRGAPYTMLSVLLSLFACAGIVIVWLKYALTPIQSAFLITYIKAEAISTFVPPMFKGVARYANIATYLRDSRYGGKLVIDLLTMPAICCMVACTLLILCGAALDGLRLRQMRQGKHIRGWWKLSVNQYNRKVKGDGFAVRVL